MTRPSFVYTKPSFKDNPGRQLNQVYEYSTIEWRLKFNAAKSAVVLFGENENSAKELKLGAYSIPISPSSDMSHSDSF